MQPSRRAVGRARRGPQWPRGGVTKATPTKRAPAQNPLQTGIPAMSGRSTQSGR
jgi:hypothetical protein